MEVVSRCALPAAGFVWQPRAGAWTFTVVCKATFHLRPGECPIAGTQVPLVWDDVAGMAGGRWSLRAATDIVPFKRLPEVIVVGHAYAPAGCRVDRLRVRVAVGAMDKSADVHGDRHFDLEGYLSPCASFERMPLAWDRAPGGPDTPNPAGMPMGSDAIPDIGGRVPVPNILPPGAVLTSPEDKLPPIGFGPIAATWPGRAHKLLSTATAWDAARWREGPIPADLDSGYFNSAPEDQLLPQIADGERIVLEGLSPDHPVLTTRLAVVRRVALASIKDEPATPVPLVADTLVIDTDARLVTVTYRGKLRLDSPDREGWVVLFTLDPPAVSVGPGLAAPVDHDPDDDIDQTLARPVRAIDSQFLMWPDPETARPPTPAIEAPSMEEASAIIEAVLEEHPADPRGSTLPRGVEIARRARELAAVAERGDLETARELSDEIAGMLATGAPRRAKIAS